MQASLTEKNVAKTVWNGGRAPLCGTVVVLPSAGVTKLAQRRQARALPYSLGTVWGCRISWRTQAACSGLRRFLGTQDT